ncbi:hypothetical protein DFH06DRAFT_1407125 [Mycena polygramma]|nr:hypothetical protein DFH06DRAFT_1407125 [Mycena polygramma]
MSSDGYFDDDDFDDAALRELDAIEAAHSRVAPTRESSFDQYDLFPDLDQCELARLDTFIEESFHGKAQLVTGPSKTGSRASPWDLSAPQGPRPKKWDQTAFSRSGAISKGNGKAVSRSVVEQLHAPFVSAGCPPPMKLRPDLHEAKHWVYPLNHPKRAYQYDIVKQCLFNNTIVALPTGLGKTFVAGVVMLNYYRWFPEGKVVFLAPTKPLVAQQMDACQKNCGMCPSDAVQLTGQNAKKTRATAWKTKRVFYMTPETLHNDLLSETCDPADIVLVVFDEAHKASGDYAYNQVVRFMMAKNPHFRVLALTATPGADQEAVQALVDGLHISRIEIRDENSLGLQAYLHKTTVEQHVIVMTEEVNRLKDHLVRLMESVLEPLQTKNLMSAATDPVCLHPYAAQAKMGKLKPNEKWALRPLATLSCIARVMGYLLEGTIGMFNTAMRDMEQSDANGDGKAASTKTFRTNPLFRAVMQELDLQRLRGFSMHPKMERMKALVVKHFTEKTDEEMGPTKVMVFVTFREAADEIVNVLNDEQPLIRASKFIGQGTDKQGKRGLRQKEQMEVIQDFRSGALNVLVATSIGEEGLDIGEVDLIVCYDAQKAPIRMLQRVGRTGRKRDGIAHVLLSEKREERNMDKAERSYKEVQRTIVSGDQLEFYSDVERLLPDYIEPQCVEKVLEIPEYVGHKPKKQSFNRDAPKGTKRKRNEDVSRATPDRSISSFISGSDLRVMGSSRKRVKAARDWEQAGEDDDIDIDIESGLIFPPSRDAPVTSSEATSISRSKIIASNAVEEDDACNEDGGLLPSLPSSPSKGSLGIVTIDRGDDSPPRTANMAWLLDQDDEMEIDIVDSSPVPKRRGNRVSRSLSEDPLPVDANAASFKSTDKYRANSPVAADPDSAEAVEASALIGGASPAKCVEFGTEPSPIPSPAVRPRRVRRRGDIPRPPSVPSLSLSRSPTDQMGLPPPRLFRRKSSPSREGHRHLLRRELTLKLGPLLDTEAVHSGDGLSERSSGSEAESESDREFLRSLPETQMSTGYDQSLVYRRSLLSQAAGEEIPTFVNRPVRNGRFGGGLSEDSRHRPQLSSSLSSQDSGQTTDAYESSFVSADEESVSLSAEG